MPDHLVVCSDCHWDGGWSSAPHNHKAKAVAQKHADEHSHTVLLTTSNTKLIQPKPGQDG